MVNMRSPGVILSVEILHFRGLGWTQVLYGRFAPVQGRTAHLIGRQHLLGALLEEANVKDHSDSANAKEQRDRLSSGRNVMHPLNLVPDNRQLGANDDDCCHNCLGHRVKSLE